RGVGRVGGAWRVVGIVGGEEDAVASCRERADFTHHLALVAEIETCGRLVEHDELRLLAGHSYPDHHVRCLDDGPSLIPGLEIEISDRFVRDCGCNDHPIANVDPDMGRRSTFLDLDDLALELITRAQLLHGLLLSKIRCYGRCHALPRDDPSKSAFLKSCDPIAADSAQRSHTLPIGAGRGSTR